MAIRFLFLCVIFFLAQQVQAQTRTLNGTLTDQVSKTPLRGASVQLKSLSDSSTQRSLTDSTGTFSFNNLRSDSFQLSISYVGYQPVSRRIVLDSTDLNLDIAAVTTSSSELETVVIRTSISPVSQKGDTLQINASQFKVNPDASGEDLIRKVPGVTIEDGVVKAQGENVQKVTIDGRELFGDDATAALRNLPAEIIDKIQIFDRLSDQAQFTGVDDGNTSKSINIVTKANMRNGQFGRIYAGYGTDERYLAGGNATFLKNNRRISVVGNFNNVNQQNFSQQDLLGVTSTSQRGGGGGGNRGGGGAPRGGGGNVGGGPGGGNFGNNGNFLVGQQNGINRTNAVGINYSDLWGKKITVSGSYLFNNTNNATLEESNRQYYSSSQLDRNDRTEASSRNNNHRINARFEYRIDSSNQLIITPNLSFQDNSTNRTRITNSFYDDTSHRDNDQINKTDNIRTGNNLNNSILYRHSFKKRGRTFSVNFNTSYNQRSGDNYQDNLKRTYHGTGYDDSTFKLFQDQFNNGLQLSGNFVYTEPISQKSQLQLNYNPSVSKSRSDQMAYQYDEINDKYSIFDPNRSNKFENRTDAQNAGITYRYGDRDNQVSFGLNYQNLTLKSDQTFPNELNVNQSFTNFLPNAMLRLKLTDKSNIRFFYRASTNNPSVTQLQPVADVNNAPYVSMGNPQLKRQYTHVLSGRYTFTNQSKGLLFVGNVFAQRAQDYITNASRNVRFDSVIFNGQEIPGGSELTYPVNLDGYTSLRSFLTFAVPLRFIKTNLNLNGGVTYNKLPALINDTFNSTKNLIYTLGVVLASNVSQYVDFTISYSANFNSVDNYRNINKNIGKDYALTGQSNYFQHNAGVQLNLLSKKGWFFQNDLNNRFNNDLDLNYFLWNMSVGRKLLKGQKGEIKLSVFDLLNQNTSFERVINERYIEDVRNLVLQRYFMLSFTYNLRNFGTAAARAANRRTNSGM